MLVSSSYEISKQPYPFQKKQGLYSTRWDGKSIIIEYQLNIRHSTKYVFKVSSLFLTMIIQDE